MAPVNFPHVPPSWAAELAEIAVDKEGLEVAINQAEGVVKAAALDPSNGIKEQSELEHVSTGPAASSLENHLNDALKSGNLPKAVNNPIGRLWAKHVKNNEKLRAEYLAVGKSYEAQRRFKLQWARETSEVMREERERITEFSQADTCKGKYLPLAVHIREEGGDAEAFRAVQNYVKNVAALSVAGVTYHGRPWVIYDKMYGRAKFLRVDEGFEQYMRETWTKRAKTGSGSSGDGGADTAAASVVDGPRGATFW